MFPIQEPNLILWIPLVMIATMCSYWTVSFSRLASIKKACWHMIMFTLTLVSGFVDLALIEWQIALMAIAICFAMITSLTPRTPFWKILAVKSPYFALTSLILLISIHQMNFLVVILAAALGLTSIALYWFFMSRHSYLINQVMSDKLSFAIIAYVLLMVFITQVVQFFV